MFFVLLKFRAFVVGFSALSSRFIDLNDDFLTAEYGGSKTGCQDNIGRIPANTACRNPIIPAAHKKRLR
jgi:hypothetical protein